LNPDKKQILFLTSTNLACNPRCLKEVRLMNDLNAQITVVAFHLHNWTDEKEKDLRKELHRVKFHYLEAGRKPLFTWLYSTFLEKASRLLPALLPHSPFLAALAIDKRSFLLYEWIIRNKDRFDLIIAHNPPAFYSAAALAKKSGTPFALDIEDYHPGEGSREIVRESSGYLMRRFLKRTAYASYASPLIKKYAVENEYDGDGSGSLVINNTFPASEFIWAGSGEPVSEKLQIVWFSQFIDYGRGLEKVLPALDRFRDRIELTLFGSIREDFSGKEIQKREYINCPGPLSQLQLHRSLGAFDIGLALEDGTVDLNRSLCLTNKIWSYYLAGLYIVATDTEAQQLFLKERPQHGTCTTLSGEMFGKLIEDLSGNKQSIRGGRRERSMAASSEGWENESLLLKRKWREILS
jgi:hypothetical protein